MPRTEDATVEPLAPEETAVPAARRERLDRAAGRLPGLRSRRPAAALALLFFTAPALAALTGERADEFENRTLADPPSLAEGFGFLPALGLWADDHLPLRQDAVELDAALTERVGPGSASGGSAPAGVPSSSTDEGSSSAAPEALSRAGEDAGVLVGAGGRLFKTEDLGRTCAPLAQAPDVVAGARRMADMLATSGRELLVTVVPNKSLVEYADLPADAPYGDCYELAAGARWDLLDSDPVTGRVPLLAELRRTEVEVGPTYLRLDLHWSDLGALTYTRALLEHLQPGLWDEAAVERGGERRYQGDLTRVRGAVESDTTPVLEVDRPGVRVTTTRPEEVYPGWFRHRSFATGQAPLYRQGERVVVLADSFGDYYRELLAPYVADLTVTPLPVRASPEDLDRAVGQVVADVLAADVVVWEQVERTLFGQGAGPLFAPEFLDRLEAALAREAARD